MPLVRALHVHCEVGGVRVGWGGEGVDTLIFTPPKAVSISTIDQLQLYRYVSPKSSRYWLESILEIDRKKIKK